MALFKKDGAATGGAARAISDCLKAVDAYDIKDTKTLNH